MSLTHKFDKSFGPVASFSGTLIFVAGLITTFFALSGLILVFFGAFIGFTNSSTTIDTENKKVRFTENIFGIIKSGKWLKVDQDMQIGTRQESSAYRTYSMSNRSIDLRVDNTIMYLFDQKGNPLIPIMQLKKGENPQEKMDEICRELEISRLT